MSAAPALVADKDVHALAFGAMRATVRAADGGRVASLWRDDPKGRRVDVLVPMAPGAYDPQIWPKAGCYPLVPWSNRIRDARFPFGGRTIALPPHPASAPHAVHGFAQTRPWQVTAAGESTLEMRYDHEPDAWPWAFAAVQKLSLDAAGLTIAIAVTNRASEPMPCGLGVHPFFKAGPGDRVRFTADLAWDQDSAGCGTAARALSPAASRHDAALDATAVTDYRAGFGGMASIARADGSRIVLQTGAPFDHVVFHVPAGGAYACIEPVTHVADAFNLAARGVEGSGMRTLAPGQTLAGLVRLGLA